MDNKYTYIDWPIKPNPSNSSNNQIIGYVDDIDFGSVSFYNYFGKEEQPKISSWKNALDTIGECIRNLNNRLTNAEYKLADYYYIVTFDPNGGYIGQQYSIDTEAENSDNAQYIYLKGTARDVNSNIINTIPCEINVNGGNNLVNNQLRGLHLVTINKQTLEMIESFHYDTYGEILNSTGKYNDGVTLLRNKLNEIKTGVAPYNIHDVFVCLVSFDAVGWNDDLISELQNFGMSDLPYTLAGRFPFIFIGSKDLGKGNGLTIMNSLGSWNYPIAIRAYVSNGNIIMKEHKSLSKTKFIPVGTKMNILPVPTKENYRFTSWCTTPDGTGKYISIDTIINDNITLYARWESTNITYNITFNANGGYIDGGSNNGSTITYTVAKNSRLEDCINDLRNRLQHRDHYNFIGYWTTPDGTGENISIDTIATSNATYYARWTPAQDEPETTYYWYAGTTPVDGNNYTSISSQVTTIPTTTTITLNNEYLYIVAPGNKTVTVVDKDGYGTALKTYDSTTGTFTNAFTTVNGYAIYKSVAEDTNKETITIS